MRKMMPILLLGSILLAACGLYPFDGVSTQRNYTSNGERIYFTATDKDGNYISNIGGPAYGATTGGTLACVSCHGPKGRGSAYVQHMQWMGAPPIYYNALVQLAQKQSGGTPQPGGYNLDDFRKAVVEGEDPNGNTLNPNMPRWQMNDADLADLLEYLKSLP
jgi:mono/diheme cytochrome c family protein